MTDDADGNTLVSLSGKIWRFRPASERVIERLIQEHKLPPLLARILAARGLDPDHVEAHLNPRLRDSLPDPFSFKDMDKAATRIADAIQSRQKIALFGDYDVDGATSTALMARFLRFFGLGPTIHIPDRLLEGYGPNVPAFEQFVADKHDLIITLDCGVSGHAPLAVAADAGVDVVVLDHHMAPPELPKAAAIVNPNRLDESGQYGYLCAAGVTFITLIAISQRLKDHDVAVPNLLEWLDLVALGTVCDVVPMVDVNRAFVAQGLRVMAKRQNIGLKALGKVAGIDQAPTTYQAGFVFGPRLNAGGRIADSNLGTELLSTHDTDRAMDIVHELDGLNRERQEIEKHSVQEALGMVARDPDKFSHMIVLASRDWHAGVIGLIAARLKEQYHRPACIIALDENGKGKASGRSINGLDLGALVLNAKMAGLIADGGGHAMAAGFSIAEEKIDALLNFFQSEMKKQFGDTLPPPEISVDAILAPSGVQLSLAEQMQQLEPHGPGNATPKLVLGPVRLQRIDVVKEKHLRITFSDMTNLQRISVMAFQQNQSPLHKKLLELDSQQALGVLGSLKVNSWQGRKEAQFLADDIAVMTQETVERA